MILIIANTIKTSMNIFEKGLDDDVSTLIKKILTKIVKGIYSCFRDKHTDITISNHISFLEGI